METVCSEAVPLNQKPLTQLNRIAKRPPLDIEFQDLVYSVRDGNSKGGWRQLLKSVNGKFCSGQLTAILGPSGAGKSTLLNILAGYVTAGVKGTIKVNERPREMKIFNKLSSYIMQEDIVQPHLTVREAMIFAASLKLGSHINYNEKIAVVDEVINLLGLETCYQTKSEHLSGGQRKRLVVALELVNNPPVIFLDEPTSGLDNVAIKQCMDLLEKISKLGRTVICTIHQPPSSLFQSFDQVYFMANGYCVYNGLPSELVPFLSQAGFVCPPSNSPADFIIELAQSHPTSVAVLSNNIQNGKVNMVRVPTTTSLTYESFDIYNETTQSGIQDSDITFPTSFCMQLKLLLMRMFMQMRRNQTVLYIQFFHHLLSGLLLGGIFFGIGNDASQTIAIFKYCISVNVFFMYTHVMSPVLLFPLEVKLMKREYFNRWYSLRAYYCAMTISNLPLLIIFGLMFLFIAYFTTNQPMDMERFMWFSIMGIMVGICSQGLGYAIGSICSITNGSIVGPSVLAPLLALAVYGMGYKSSIEPFMKFLMSLSYLRYGIVGFCNAIFDNRAPLECIDEIYCHYRNPEILLKDMGMSGSDLKYQILGVFVFMLIFRITGYLALKYRLNSELSNKIVYFANKIIKQKEKY